MFHVGESRFSRGFQLAMGGLALLSLTALVVTAWILADFQHEQASLARIMRHLPEGDIGVARELAGELRLQERLSVLLILNIVATGVALAMLVRAYVSSERSLRAVKVLATDVLASMDQGVLTTDQNAVVMSINPSGRDLLSGSDDAIGKSLADLSREHGALNDICRHVLKYHDCVRDHDYELRRNGHARTLRAGCSLLRDGRQRRIGTVLHVRDVTERVLMEQRLRRMERYIGLGSLAAGLHHEIKNPLSALSLHVQLLGESLEQRHPEAEISEMLSVLRQEVSRINTVLERFRDFTSITQLHRSTVDLVSMINKLARLMQPQALRQGVRVELDLPEQPSPVSVDEVRFEQVLLNLFVNALEAMPEGGLLTVRLRRTPESARIEVGDTGCGVPEDLRERIFDPYFTTRGDGTGMGLAICERIVQQHDGTIQCATGPEGTVFAVALPLEKDS